MSDPTDARGQEPGLRAITPELSAILLDSLRALAAAGEAEAACLLAGRACAALRHDHLAEWKRFNALLHRLSPRTGPVS